MSGHSKWSKIRHGKAKEDSKRGKLFSRLIKEITVAARLGGGDPNMNPRLRAALTTAKAANMPQDNIKRAIQKGTGELPGQMLEEVIYEGYGPGGVAVLVEAVTDNRNRTTAEIRHLFSKYAGNLGENGCVSWMFEKRGYFVVDKSSVSEDKLLEIALEAGADDVKDDDENFEVLSSPEVFDEIQKALEANQVEVAASEIAMIPQTYVKLQDKKAVQMLKLMDFMEDHDDVQNVWANFDINEEDLPA